MKMTREFSLQTVLLYLLLISLFVAAPGFAETFEAGEASGTPYFSRQKLLLPTSGGIEKTIINGPPHPPKGFVRTTAALLKSNIAAGVNIISDVPAFTWCFGCSATSAAMVAGYYDRNGYPNMYIGLTNSGVMPLNNDSYWTTWADSCSELRNRCPVSATQQGLDGRTIRGHVDDYWVCYGDDGEDPFVSNGWAEHAPGECTADFMKTSQASKGNSDGSTTFYNYIDGSPLYDYMMTSGIQETDGGYGFKLFYESRGYEVLTMYNQLIYGYNGNTLGFTFDQYKAEIDAGRPVMIHVEGHTMVGLGYDDSTNLMYIHDTWDHSLHTMTWSGEYGDMAHYGVTVVRLAPVSGPEYSLNVTTSGSGTVNISPSGPDYAPGTQVTLTAQPGAGYMFDAWYGDSIGTQTSVTITMDRDKSVIAQFIPQYVLTRTVSPAGSGIIQVNPEGPYPKNTVVSLTAVPAAGYVFDHWGGAVTGTTNPTSVTMTSNKTVTAYFRENIQYSLTVTRYGSGTVTVTPTGPYAPGTQVTLRATPAAGYVFKGWGGDATGTVNPLTVTMNANKTISATFEQSITSWMLTVLPCTNGSISPGSGPQQAGTWIPLTANPAPGYKLSQWTGDMGGSQNPKSILMDGNKTVGAEFVQIPYVTLTVNTTGSGTVGVDPPGPDYAPGTPVTLTAMPDPGQFFNEWNDSVTGAANPFVITMNSNETVNADFQAYVPALYYPHVECRNTWDTEICAINTGTGDVTGEFTAYNASGVLVESLDASLSSLERLEINVGTAFTNPDNIRYIVFNATAASDALAGYTKFFRTGLYRAALPAVSAVNTGTINIPHIASNKNWWTGIALLNTTTADKNDVTLEFNTGDTYTLDLPAGGYAAFTIAEAFPGVDSGLLSAVIPDGGGLIGLELFGHNKSAILSGLLLTDETVTELYYPHVTSDNWWTGLVAFNPYEAVCDITIRPYEADGTALTPVPISIAGGEKYVGTFGVDLDLPVNTDWLAVEASHGITGFELFGQTAQVDGFSADRLMHNAGVFCKLASGGTAWTGISIVNTSDTQASVAFRAMDDSGGEIDNVSIDFDPHEKWVGLPEDMFAGDITDATYVVYRSDVPVAAFQLNGEGSGTNKMLDGLPAMRMESANQAPAALPDTAEVTNGYAFVPVVMNVLANDSDPDGDPLEIIDITSEYDWHGSSPFYSIESIVEITANAIQSGCFTIREDKKAIVFDLGEDHQYDTGTATCTYTISDGKGGTAVSTLTVTVEDQSTPF